MISIPPNPNSISVSMIQTGCLAAEFDSTYPVHLNGIISQYEFQESINKINRTVSSSKSFLITCWIIFGVTLTAGTLCYVIGGATAAFSLGPAFFILMGLGTLLTIVGSVLIPIAICVVTPKRIARMRQAVAEESAKYSSRSSIPCSWRLDTSRNWGGPYGNQNGNQLAYNLIIDIGRSLPVETDNRIHYSSKVAPAPMSVSEQQDNYAPPAYSIPVSTVCSQCNALRQDLSAKFCSTSGHSFNRY